MTLAARFAAFKDPLAAFSAGVQAAKAEFDQRRMIWTDEGHKFADELTNEPHWVVEADGKVITFLDTWKDKAGKVVSQAVHSYSQRALTTETVAGDVNQPTLTQPGNSGASS